MANHDYNIANATAPQVRADINNALLAIVSTNSGSSQPSTMFANQLWYDTTNNQLKMRNEANNAWIVLLESDQTNNRVNLITDDIQYATSGVTEVKIHLEQQFFLYKHLHKQLLKQAQKILK